MGSPSREPPDARPTRWPYGPVTFAEMTAGLIWPMLLRAPAIALQPPRVAVGFLIVVLAWLTAWLMDGVLSLMGHAPVAQPLVVSVVRSLDAAARLLLSGDLVHAAQVLVTPPWGPSEAHGPRRWFWTIVAGALLLPAWAIGGTALARMAAVDVALNLNMTASQGLRFALARWKAAISALAIPALLAMAISLLIALGGFALLSLPFVDALGGLAFGLAMVGGLAIVLLGAGLGVAQLILLPAVAVEASDAGDAVQRAYAYILGRTGRALLYAAVCLVQGALVYVVARWALDAAGDLAGSFSTAWLPADKAARLLNPADPAAPLAARIIAFWRDIMNAVLAGAMVSLFFSSGSIVYLLLRRVNDEQDIREVWMPGVIPGTTAPDRASRDRAL